MIININIKTKKEISEKKLDNYRRIIDENKKKCSDNA